MSRIAIVIAAALAFAVTLSAAPAQAQRVFVSGTGSDGNPCTFASPCRSFQHAHDVASSGGEIDVLDPAGYGALTINRAISIQGHGFSGITVGSGVNGITINGGSTDNVTLNGLLIEGGGVGSNGIVFNVGASLTVTGCVVQNLHFTGSTTTGNGILIQPTSGTISFVITNTIVSNNPLAGIIYLPPSGSATANGVIDHVVATNNGTGILFDNSTGSTTAAISNSIASNNTNGIIAEGGGALAVSIDNTGVSRNILTGISGSNSAKVTLGRSVITANGIGISNTTSNTFYSYSDNRINGNVTDISAALNYSFTLQ
jgi:hypothetical protein